MKEIQPSFSDKEKTEIAECARQAAREGEDCVWSLVLAKIDLMKLGLRGRTNGVVVDNVYYTPAQFRHEVDLVSEVIDQARIIMQIEGRDSISELNQHAENLGLGSLFDPESEAFKRFGHLFVD